LVDPKEADERALVDQIAMVFESAGLPPVAGRILGRLLICDPPEQSSSDLGEYCDASKGAISTSTRMLMAGGLVERVRVRGQRGHYFRIKEDGWTYALHAEVQRIRTLRQLAERGLEMLSHRPPEQLRRLQEFHDVQAFFERELPVVISHWDEQRGDE
jgi:DNA-binding transcriptional regulator GbsR (MarR family)